MQQSLIHFSTFLIRNKRISKTFLHHNGWQSLRLKTNDNWKEFAQRLNVHGCMLASLLSHYYVHLNLVPAGFPSSFYLVIEIGWRYCLSREKLETYFPCHWDWDSRLEERTCITWKWIKNDTKPTNQSLFQTENKSFLTRNRR